MSTDEGMQNVFDCVIRPLSVLYGALPKERQAAYIDELSGYTRQELAMGVQTIKETYEAARFPAVATLHKACKAAQEKCLGQIARAEQKTYPWVERDRKRDETVRAYMRQAMERPLFIQAKQEGWSHHLFKFIRECALIQAEIMFPAPHGYTSYRSNILDNPEGYIRQLKQDGVSEIKVFVPKEMMERWKAMPPVYGNDVAMNFKAA